MRYTLIWEEPAIGPWGPDPWRRQIAIPDPSIDITHNGSPFVSPGAPVRNWDNRQRLLLNAEMVKWWQDYQANLVDDAFYVVDLYCGRCMVEQRGKRHPSRKTIGWLECWGDTWDVNVNGYSDTVGFYGTPNVLCDVCGLDAQITASADELTTFFLLRSQRRRRQSLAYLVKIGLAREFPPPTK